MCCSAAGCVGAVLVLGSGPAGAVLGVAHDPWFGGLDGLAALGAVADGTAGPDDGVPPLALAFVFGVVAAGCAGAAGLLAGVGAGGAPRVAAAGEGPAVQAWPGGHRLRRVPLGRRVEYADAERAEPESGENQGTPA